MGFCFAKCVCDRLTEDANFDKTKIILSNEDHFDLAEYENKKKKIVAFGTQKTRTHTLKSRRTQKDSLFGADFCPEE